MIDPKPFDRLVLIVCTALSAVLVLTMSASRSQPSAVVGIYPSTGSKPPATISVRLKFNQPMDPASVQEKFSIRPSLHGEVSWDENTLIFRPHLPFQSGTEYQVQLEQGAKTRFGIAVSGIPPITFAPRAPSILFLSPADSNLRSLMEASIDGSSHLVYSSPLGIDSFSASPDGSRIALTVNGPGNGADIVLVNRDGSGAKQITDCGQRFCGRAVWSPNGKVIAYEQHSSADVAEGTSSRIWLFHLDDSSIQPLFADSTRSGFDIVWSHDSETVAYYDPDLRTVGIVHLLTGDVTLLPSQMGQTGEFSPDDKSMVYTDLHQVGLQVFSELWLGLVGDVNSFDRLDLNSQDDQFPAWAPTGKWIAFGRREINQHGGLATQLALYNTQSKSIRVVTSDRALNSTDFQWDPTGRMIIMSRFELGSPDSKPGVWLYDLSTNSLRQIATNGLDGRWIP